VSALLRTFRFPLLATIVGVVLAGVIGGGKTAAIVAILAVLEISLSFDNAVINATVLQRMSEKWQRLFLTIGVLIAVFGMRLLFPLLVVGVTAKVGPVRVIDLAINHPHEYAERLTSAHGEIAAFGGIFLLMIFLDFLFEDREIRWIGPVELLTARLGKLQNLSAVIACVVLIVTAKTLAQDGESGILISGLAGLAVYLVVGALSEIFDAEGESEDADEDGVPDKVQKGPVLAVGRAAFFLFLYLEVLDASFSFDGVVGAFAISNELFVIAAGLGIGALYIRTLTVYLVRQGTLDDYAHLEHGAHYAIGALAIVLLITIRYEVPEVVTGLIGVGFIALALMTSVTRNRRLERSTA
jgi:hypothetical protein